MNRRKLMGLLVLTLGLSLAAMADDDRRKVDDGRVPAAPEPY